MKGIISMLLLIAFLNVKAFQPNAVHDNDGIQFQQGLSWKKIVEKARAEGKSIFVDCYTTWCAPCKEMEAHVYSAKEVGEAYNAKFICVKLQMDSSARDNEQIRSTYNDARNIERKYQVHSYPSFLFFNKDGKILYKAGGAQDIKTFIGFAKSVLDPSRNFYLLLDKFKAGKANFAEMSYLARTSLNIIGDTVQAKEIATIYLKNLKKEDWFTKENIEFMGEFTTKSTDPGFDFFYNNAGSVNHIMETSSYAEVRVTNIIIEEMVNSKVFIGDDSISVNPDWAGIYKSIRGKYNNFYADRVIALSKLSWSGYLKKWDDHTKLMIEWVKKYDDTLYLDSAGSHFLALKWNNRAWNIFQYSNDIAALNLALAWSGHALLLERVPNWMDTYANLLYKLGRKNEAIYCEKVALALSTTNGHTDPEITLRLKLMEKNAPTWPVN